VHTFPSGVGAMSRVSPDGVEAMPFWKNAPLGPAAGPLSSRVRNAPGLPSTIGTKYSFGCDESVNQAPAGVTVTSLVSDWAPMS
jgi:hypothetical protein